MPNLMFQFILNKSSGGLVSQNNAEYLVDKPLQAAGMSADNVRG